MTLKIAIAVHGRFHAFDLARALLARGHDVTLLTNYPSWAVKPFGIPRERTRSFWLQGILSRSALYLRNKIGVPYPEAWLDRTFGRWVAARLKQENWDVVHLWSGVAEEALCEVDKRRTMRLMVRGSAHIQVQERLLAEEEERTGNRQDKPSRWIIEREMREYELADGIVVLSTFARSSFIAQGVVAEKLMLLPLGAPLSKFRPTHEVAEARSRRILLDWPLRILFVGTVSFQKGLWDLAEVVKTLGPQRFEYRFVGACAREARQIITDLGRSVTFTGKVPQAKLPEHYAWADIFVFPTIQDGYAVVLAQAAAAGLPILTTTNCSGPDLVSERESGWVVPIRSPQAIAERLRWADTHRVHLAAIADRVYADFQPRDWADVAEDFERLCLERLAQRSSSSRRAEAAGDYGR
jgi:glycosyltransferase involved in cell wall biosynthesis